MMRPALYFISFIILMIGCENSTDTDILMLSESNNRNLYDLKKDFKFENLEAFEIDSLDWETRPGKYTELDSHSFYLIWQDNKRDFIGTGFDRDYLYSWQDRDSNFIEITILTQDENDYCDNITYAIFDKKGKAIDSFIVSSSCGDGGWTFTAEGRFITSNTYEKLCVESQMVEYDSKNGIELYEGDSTLYHFKIQDNGQVVAEEIYTRHFETKWPIQ